MMTYWHRMVCRGSFVICFLMLLSVSLNVAAAGVARLYEVDRLVTGQSAAERKLALADALEIVLVRISGQQDVIESAGLGRVIPRARDYVERYEYTPLSHPVLVAADDLSLSQANASDGANQVSNQPAAVAPIYAQTLHIIFDKQGIDRVLTDHHVAVWGRLRPTLVVWLALDDGNRRYIVTSEGSAGIRDAMLEAGKKRGLPVILPLMDLEEQARIGFSDIWGDFFDTIRSASGRYRAGAELVGRGYRQGEGWVMRWSLYSEDIAEHWQADVRTPEAGLSLAMVRAVDFLGHVYAKVAHRRDTVAMTMDVLGVDNIADYARVLAYLDSLELVKGLVVSALRGKQVELHLQVKSDARFLRQTIEFDDTLAPAQAIDGLMSEKPRDLLIYRLLQ